MLPPRNIFSIGWILIAGWTAHGSASESIFVQSGVPENVQEQGKAWTRGDGYLECSGTGNFLFSGKAVGAGDFRVIATLSIHELDGSAASFVLGGASHFGFSGSHGKPFLEGPLFGGRSRRMPEFVGEVPQGRPFQFEVQRKDQRLVFSIDGVAVHTQEVPSGPLGGFGFRPWRSRMRVIGFSAEGDLVDIPPTWPEDLATEPVDVFVAGTEGYHTFRIPSIIVTRDRTLLAFCEGRKSGRGDAGNIDLLMRRSTDLGQTWSAIQVIWDDEQNTCGNPAPVVDNDTGRIWLSLTWNMGTDHERQIMANESRFPRRPFMTHSDDDGLTWEDPVEMPHLRESHWRWYATGPDKGIQITRGPFAGRLVVPCNHSDHRDPETHPYRSHVIYSDDHGGTWKLGGAVGPKTNESTIVELADGSILDNMRSYHGENRRAIATSQDGGVSWSEVRLDEQLVEPVCQASILRYSWHDPQEPGTKDRIVFSNPASKSREKLTVRMSYDGGQTWPTARLLYRDSAAYSCLTRLPDDRIGLLFKRDAYSRITFVPLNLKWLEGKN